MTAIAKTRWVNASQPDTAISGLAFIPWLPPAPRSLGCGAIRHLETAESTRLHDGVAGWAGTPTGAGPEIGDST